MKYATPLLLATFLSAHQYTISVLGIPIVNVTMNQNSASSLSFETKTLGVFDVIWPTKNMYSVTFDSTSFGIKTYEKDINQGTFSQSLSAHYNEKTNSIDYNNGPSVEREKSCKTILTLLAWVQSSTADQINEQWFSMEHEGDLYQSRVLLADTPFLGILGDSILTDHYRLDLKLKESGKFLDRTDYFMENIVMPGMVKQLWIEHEPPHRILQATVSVWNLDVKAKLNE